jgi:hexosaminidase
MDNQTQADLKASGKTGPQAFNDFVTAVQTTIKNAKKSPIVWHDLVVPSAEHPNPFMMNITVAKDTIVLPWNASYAQAAVDKGHRIIHADAETFYLDCGGGAWVPRNGLSGTVKRDTWCDPFKSWDHMYS